MGKHKSTGGKAVALQRRPRKRAAKPAQRSIYSVHPGVAMFERWINELAVKTGRSLDQWLKHIKEAGPKTEKECRAWLQDAHRLGAKPASCLGEKALGGPLAPSEETPEGCLKLAPLSVGQIYSGARQPLRPIHDELVRLAQLLGEDVRVCPCKTIV